MSEPQTSEDILKKRRQDRLLSYLPSYKNGKIKKKYKQLAHRLIHCSFEKETLDILEKAFIPLSRHSRG